MAIHRTLRAGCPVLAAAVLLLAPLTGQNDWRLLDVPKPPNGPIAHDDLRNQTVLFGLSAQNQAETWEWSAGWVELQPAVMPSARSGHALVFDAARGATLLFGGVDYATGLHLADTWIWDGSAWTRLTPANSPPARTEAAIAYDAARGRVVLFGGNSAVGWLNDTWEWDGTDWLVQSPALIPPRLTDVAMAFANPTVLFGTEPTTYTSETWNWDGTDWTQRTPANGPPLPLIRSALAFDPVRGVAVLVGWEGGGGTMVWEWDGTDWSAHGQLAPRRVGSTLGYHAGLGRVVLHGGTPAPVFPFVPVACDFLLWDGSQWSRFEPAFYPPPSTGQAMAYDATRGEMIVFGPDGDETWTLADTTWTHHPLTVHPSSRRDAAIAFDRARNRAVLFGGMGAAGELADTWEWDGAGWTQCSPAISPPARARHGMAYDPIEGVVVMVGGMAGATGLSDTWQWDGAAWTPRPSAHQPTAGAVALCYDVHRERIVLVAVAGLVGNFEIWDWNGVDWRRALSVPQRDRYVAAAYDVRERLVYVFGTPDIGGVELLAFDGYGLRDLQPANMPSNRRRVSLGYDEGFGRTLLFGGELVLGNTAVEPEVRVYEPGDPLFANVFGSGCAVPGGPPLWLDYGGSMPMPGSLFALTLSFVPASAPAFAMIGFSKPRAFPVWLDAIGMPGCTLYLASVHAQTLQVSGGVASWNLVMPTDPSGLGLGFYVQGGAFVTGANALDLILSNGVAARIGTF